jgi:uncharacterized repeat protein (TIGR01451 family)
MVRSSRFRRIAVALSLFVVTLLLTFPLSAATNHPELTTAGWFAGTVTVRGTLNSVPLTTFDIDFYSNSVCDPSGLGEGATWRYTSEVTTNANGDAVIEASFPYPGAGFMTATATNRTAGDISEFSNCRVVDNLLPGTIQFGTAAATVNENDGFATITVTRGGTISGPATVELRTIDGSASIPGDYLPPAESHLVWIAGDGAPKTVTIPIVANDLYELPESFSVELWNATGDILGTPAFATITIADTVTAGMPADLSAYIETRFTGAMQGEAVTYSIAVTNNGPNDATAVVVTDVLPPQLLFEDMRAPEGWMCTTPATGKNGTITCTGAVLPLAGNTAYFFLSTRVAFDAAGSVVNTVSVSHSGSDPNPGNSSFSSAPTVINATTADISITKTTSTTRAAAGSAFTYTITITNSGPDAASGVTMKDVLPPQLHYLSRVVTTTGGADLLCTTPPVSSGGTVTCNAFRMEPGASATLTLHVSISPLATSGTLTNTASVTVDSADPDSDDHFATAPGVELVAGADLSLDKRTTTTGARPNALFNYTLSIYNAGPSAATNVVLTDVLPADLLFEFVGPPAGFTCTTPALGTNGTIRCTAESLAASLLAAFTIRVRVAPGAKPGVVTNSASVTSSTLDPDDSDTTAAAAPVTIDAPAGNERRLDPSTAVPRMPQVSPQVATTRQNALAVWREGALVFVPPNGTASIRGALFRPDGDGQTLINFTAPQAGTDVTHPNVAAAADRYLVVWRETTGSQGRLLARRLRVNGSFIDAEPLVLDSGNAVACCTDLGDPRPAVASDGHDFYVAWVAASFDIRGIVVPADGPVTGVPSVISRNADTLTHGHYDVEVVWTSSLYAVAWLDRTLPSVPTAQPLVLRYARLTPQGALLDPQSSFGIAGPIFSSLTATSSPEGAVVTVDYDEGVPPGARRCVGVLLLTFTGQAADALALRCEHVLLPTPAPLLHSTFVPVARGFLLVQPGRRYTPPFADVVIRTSTADADLTELSTPTTLGVLAREVSAATWQGAALLVYNRTDGDTPATPVSRVFAFLIQGHARARAVRH